MLPLGLLRMCNNYSVVPYSPGFTGFPEKVSRNKMNKKHSYAFGDVVGVPISKLCPFSPKDYVSQTCNFEDEL